MIRRAFPALSRGARSPAVLVAALLAAAIALPGPVLAARRGADIEASKADGSVVKGELVAVSPSTVVVRDIPSGAYMFLSLADITLVRLPKISKGKGMWSGLIQGVFTGSIAGDVFSPEGSVGFERWVWRIGGGMAGGILGALMGRSFDVTTGEFETIPLKGREKAEVDQILARLRQRARIPDYR